MNNEHFKKCVKAAGLDIRKLRDLEVFEIKADARAIMTIRWSDVFAIERFREWYNRNLAPKLAPVALTEDEQRRNRESKSYRVEHGGCRGC